MLEFDYTQIGDLSPIPIANLYINNLSSNANLFHVNNAILDTGSDITLFPFSLISKVEAKSIGHNSVQPFRGLGTEIKGVPYRIGIGFEEKLIIKVKVFACPDHQLENEIIIGRNFLNRYQIEFNGPARTFLIY
jgi:hypothetical protein